MIRIKNYTLNSKLHFAPINLGYSLNGDMNDQIISFMKLRANQSIGINILGNVSIDKRYSTNSSTLSLNDKSNISKWDEYIAQCNKNNSIPGIQIAAMPIDLNPPRKWTSVKPDIEIERLKGLINSLTILDVHELLKSFNNTIELAKLIGFKYIEVHAAHGYLLSLLINPMINTNNKILLIVLNFLEQFTQSQETINAIRLSCSDGVSSTLPFYERILDMEFDFFSLSNGYYTIDKKLIYPTKNVINSLVIDHGVSLAKKKRIMIAGNIRESEIQKYSSVNNLHFSIGRPLIADHLFAKKYLSGNESEIKQCNYTGKCHHYSNQTKGGLICPMWEQ